MVAAPAGALAARRRANSLNHSTLSAFAIASSLNTSLAGAPILEGAVAVFECFNRSRYEEGDHVIFVGEVERCERRTGAQPLIFHGGRYFTELPI